MKEREIPLMTKEEVDEYFRKRGTVVKVTNIKATHPREERNGQL